MMEKNSNYYVIYSLNLLLHAASESLMEAQLTKHFGKPVSIGSVIYAADTITINTLIDGSKEVTLFAAKID